jgi:hypothetical protein
MKKHRYKKMGICEGCGKYRKLTLHHVFGKKQDVVQGVCEECHIEHNKKAKKDRQHGWGYIGRIKSDYSASLYSPASISLL